MVEGHDNIVHIHYIRQWAQRQDLEPSRVFELDEGL